MNDTMKRLDAAVAAINLLAADVTALHALVPNVTASPTPTATVATASHSPVPSDDAALVAGTPLCAAQCTAKPVSPSSPPVCNATSTSLDAALATVEDASASDSGSGSGDVAVKAVPRSTVAEPVVVVPVFAPVPVLAPREHALGDDVVEAVVLVRGGCAPGDVRPCVCVCGLWWWL